MNKHADINIQFIVLFIIIFIALFILIAWMTGLTDTFSSWFKGLARGGFLS